MPLQIYGIADSFKRFQKLIEISLLHLDWLIDWLSGDEII